MTSSVIRAFDYKPKSGQLTVAFVSGRIYVYEGVPAEIANDFRRAESKGTFFNADVRDCFVCREVTRRVA